MVWENTHLILSSVKNSSPQIMLLYSPMLGNFSRLWLGTSPSDMILYSYLFVQNNHVFNSSRLCRRCHLWSSDQPDQFSSVLRPVWSVKILNLLTSVYCLFWIVSPGTINDIQLQKNFESKVYMFRCSIYQYPSNQSCHGASLPMRQKNFAVFFFFLFFLFVYNWHRQIWLTAFKINSLCFMYFIDF